MGAGGVAGGGAGGGGVGGVVDGFSAGGGCGVTGGVFLPHAPRATVQANNATTPNLKFEIITVILLG